jgi:methionyl-tRNA formyltransferase
MKIVFWGSADFSLPSLEALRKEFDVIGVVTNTDKKVGRGMKETKMTPMKYCSLQNDLICMQPQSMKDPVFIEELKKINADLFVVAAFGHIIPEEIIYMPKYDTINLHASLLPRYRGASPIHQALLNDDNYTGNTIQFITKELDKGDIILQSKIEIGKDEFFDSLHNRLAKDGAELLIEAIKLIKSNNIKRIKQDDTKASFCKIIKKEDGLIDFKTQTAREIYNRFRAFSNWPKIYSVYSCLQRCEADKPKEIRIVLTSIRENRNLSGEAGKIININKRVLTVACKDGAIDITGLKPSGKSEMDISAFINGYHPKCGNYFQI